MAFAQVTKFLNLDLKINSMLPLHCQPPMPDWGLNKQPKEIPSEEEILKKFSKDERIKVAYTSSLLMRLLRYYMIDKVVFSLKYPRSPEFKTQSRLLQQLEQELERDARAAHHPESILWLDKCFEQLRQDCSMDMLKLSLSTEAALMKANKEHDTLRVGVVNALLTIDHIYKHGAYISQVVADRSGLEAQEFQPSQIVILCKAMMVDMADRLDCEVDITDNMHLALDILVNKYLAILKI